jgi:hypothetical protein
VHDLCDQAGTAAAARACAAMIADVGAGSCAILYASSDFAVGDTVAVANDHERLENRSLLKVIVKVVL